MKILVSILVIISFWSTALPLSELNLHVQETQVAQEACCHHSNEADACSEEGESHNDNHCDHNCTPQCHCKSFGSHLFISSPKMEQFVAVMPNLHIEKPTTHSLTDFSEPIFQPPRNI